MQVRCPQCHTPIDLASDGELSDIACPSCGSSFSLLGSEETAPLAHEQVKTIGHFELTEQIGVGTFGSVWRARDVDLDRTVAVKIPRKGQLDPQETEQFLREARAAAQLRHSGIVSVHEVGREKDTVFIVSDLVEGVTLADRLTAQPFSSREAAELCAKVADALQHAHEAGVIHRDLKTGNIMLDAEGEPHILDFGLARREAGEVTMTVEGRVLGTPAYLSPEQAQGEAHTADGRSDVYSLGVILFELLTGERPFRGNIRMLIHQVIHEESPSPRRFNASVPRDLETICLKCLEKDPDKRYQAAGELGAELRRYLAGEPINARPVSRTERCWRWCKRNPVVAGLTAAVAVLLLSGSLISAFLAAIANDNAAEADKRRYTSDMLLAGSSWDDSNFGMVNKLLRSYVPRSPDDDDYRGLEWYLLWKCCQRRLESKVIPLESPISSIHVAPDGNELAVAYSYGGVTRVELDTYEISPRFGGRCKDFFLPVSYSPDGAWLAHVSHPGNRVTLRNLKSGEERAFEYVTGGIVKATSFSHDGQFVAVTGTDGVMIWALSTAEQITTFDRFLGPTTESFNPDIAFSPVENKLAIANHGEVVFILDLSAPESKPEELLHSDGVMCLAFSPQGDKLATGGNDSLVTLWDLATANKIEETKRPSTVTTPTNFVRSIAFSLDGQMIAAGGVDYVVQLYDAEDLQELTTLKGLSGTATGLAFLSNGRLVSGSTDSTVVIWPSLAREDRDVFSYKHKIPELRNRRNQVVLSPNRTIIASTCPGGVKIWTWQGQIEMPDNIEVRGLVCLALANDKTLAAGYTDGTVRLYDRFREVTPLLPPEEDDDRVTAMCFSDDGSVLAVGTKGGVFCTWDVASKTPCPSEKRHDDVILAIAYSHQRQEFATGGNDQTIKLWSARDGAFVDELGKQEGFVRSLAYAPDGVTLASGGFDPTLWIWNTANRDAEPRQIEAHASGTFAIDFSPDGKMLATGGRDGEFTLWDADTFTQRISLTGHKNRLYHVAFDPDSRQLLTTSVDGTYRLWRAATPAEVEASQWWRDVMSERR